MSIETKEAAKTTKKYLDDASKYLEAAKETSRKTGDGGLVKKVEKLHQDAGQVRQDLEKRLTEKS